MNSQFIHSVSFSVNLLVKVLFCFELEAAFSLIYIVLLIFWVLFFEVDLNIFDCFYSYWWLFFHIFEIHLFVLLQTNAKYLPFFLFDLIHWFMVILDFPLFFSKLDHNQHWLHNIFQRRNKIYNSFNKSSTMMVWVGYLSLLDRILSHFQKSIQKYHHFYFLKIRLFFSLLVIKEHKVDSSQWHLSFQ